MGDILSYLKFNEEHTNSNHKNSQASYIKWITKFICHGKKERTFNFKGRYFPVCSRCTGLYIGVFLCFIYIIHFYINYSSYLLLISVLMIIPTFTDGITQLLCIRESTNLIRFLTGMIAGSGLVILINCVKWIIIMN